MLLFVPASRSIQQKRNEMVSSVLPDGDALPYTSDERDTNDGLSAKDEPVALKREIGLFSAVGLIVSVMIGSGIFISPKSVLEKTGSPYACLLVWGLCGFISYLGALAFAELGTLVPTSGAEYAYYQAAFSKNSSVSKFWGSLPGFIYVWVVVFLSRPASVAILVLTFAEYLYTSIVGQINVDVDPWNERLLKKMIGLLAICIITYINFSSVKLYVKIQNLFSSLKVLACVFVIVGGLNSLIFGQNTYLNNGFKGTKLDVKNVALAFFSGLWSFDGWSSVTIVTEEIMNPNRNIPLSISIAVPLITGLYFMMNLSYMTVLSYDELISAPTVATAFADKIFGSLAFLIPLAVALSTFGCGMSVQFGVSRLCYAAGRNGHMIESMSFIHIRRYTPAPAVVLQGLLSFTFIVTGSIIELIEFVGFLLWIFYGLAMIALLVMRKTQPDVVRPYKVPTVIPILIIAIALILSTIPIVLQPAVQYLVALGFICVGVIFYNYFIFKEYQPRFLGRITYFVQVLFEVVPPGYHPESFSESKEQ